MLRLETIEDFEKVRKSLDSPKATASEWTIRTFGFCTFCDEVTEYGGSYGPEDCSETCEKCNRTFSAYGNGHPRAQYITDLGKVSDSATRVKLDQLRSRKQQRGFFAQELEHHIKKAKSAHRSSGNAVRRLAKLRG